ncbi:hypothetical protein JCM11251_004059 [Rhodosporidiobolus azoricus]
MDRMLYGQRLLMAGRVLVLNGCFFHLALWRSSSWSKTVRLAFARRFRHRSPSLPVVPPTSLEIASLQLSLLSHYLLPPLLSLLTLTGTLNFLTYTAILLLHSVSCILLLAFLKMYSLLSGQKMRIWRKSTRNSVFSIVVVIFSFV